MLLAIADRPIDTNTTFTTGGDVSRFQRRTVPGRKRPSPRSRQVASARRMPAAAPRRPARWSVLLAAMKSPLFRWELAKMNIQQSLAGRASAPLLRRWPSASPPSAAAGPAGAQPKAYASGTYRPASQVLLSVGEGQMVNLPRSVASVWTSNPKVADVYVNSPRQINMFGKEAGEATVIATAADGSVVYGANVRVNQNISSINEILRQAMPGLGHQRHECWPGRGDQRTVASPDDAAQAEMLVSAALNPGIDVTRPTLRSTSFRSAG